MIICNITMQVGWNIHDAWLNWIKVEYIPGMLEDGSFYNSQLSRLKDVGEEEGPTYCIQFFTHAKSLTPNLFLKNNEHFSERISRRWGNDCVAFRTIMEVIH